MNKNLKIVLVAFVVTSIFSVTGVFAATPKAWVNVTLPALSGTEMSNTSTYKSTTSWQHNKVTTAKDNLTGLNRAVSARTIGKTNSEWIDCPIGSMAGWGSRDANGNNAVGDYRLQVKATKSTLSTVNYSGTWYPDENY